ncbi:hypothetical protein FA10DRAFT_264739 [Acaromyces ingoldii]|uniref:DUF1996 domain-containing protein n=1 Tax=Acaromyces ingoldii TaxID=215250 RepID=A0A316YYA7_9BASI|nr:hypothetical protein FA10DRAFT_264739 [Acaromyces ingoldii]PWN94171.1 hypothetical protein FA10DRAFT_264739 [Acaromyces ingoldii]
MTKLSCALLVGAFFSLSFLVGHVHSFFILSHHGSLLNARLDPIVSPGKVSGHLHSFVGSSSISSDEDYDSVRGDDACTTSGVGADLSSYWTPTLFQYSQADDSFTAMNLSFVNTYYLNRGGSASDSSNSTSSSSNSTSTGSKSTSDSSKSTSGSSNSNNESSNSTKRDSSSTGKIVAFPKGFRMLAGDAMARQPANTTQLRNAISFVCLNYDGQSPQTSTIPTGPCPDGLRAQITFPSCWDGKNLDSEDHKSHVAYPEGDNADSGDCPSSHPHRFMTLFYEFVWSTGKTATNPDESKWVFANGDMQGVSFHGDFLNGWDVDVLQEAIDSCTGSLFNNLEQCAPLAKSLDRDAASKCAIKQRSSIKGISPETVSGPLKSLPGCNTIFNGKLKGQGGCSGGDEDTGSSSSSSSSSTSSSSSPASTSTSKHRSSAKAAAVRKSSTSTSPSLKTKGHGLQKKCQHYKNHQKRRLDTLES